MKLAIDHFIAARYLKMKGIEDVLRLFGGIEEWVFCIRGRIADKKRTLTKK